MLEKLVMILNDHMKQVYGFVFSNLSHYKPDLVALEGGVLPSVVTIGPDFFEERELSGIPQGKKTVERKKTKKGTEETELYLSGEKMLAFPFQKEYAAGLDYALDNNKPLFFVDEKKGNAIYGLNNGEFVRLEIPFTGPVCRKSLEITERNRFMACAINLLSERYNLRVIAYIGGIMHADERECIPLQKMIKARKYVIINAKDETTQDL